MKKVKFEIVAMVRGNLPEDLSVEHVIREVRPKPQRKKADTKRREETRRRIAFYFPKGDE